MSSKEVFEALSAGDHILFNDRRDPLIVDEVGTDRVQVTGPQGGKYVLHVAPDAPEMILVSQHGNPEYASKVGDLRIVGVWEQPEPYRWHHTGLEASIEVVKNDLGYWTIAADGIDISDIDVPGYGYTNREPAVEDIERFVRTHPEPEPATEAGSDDV